MRWTWLESPRSYRNAAAALGESLTMRSYSSSRATASGAKPRKVWVYAARAGASQAQDSTQQHVKIARDFFVPTDDRRFLRCESIDDDIVLREDLPDDAGLLVGAQDAPIDVGKRPVRVFWVFVDNHVTVTRQDQKAIALLRRRRPVDAQSPRIGRVSPGDVRAEIVIAHVV